MIIKWNMMDIRELKEKNSVFEKKSSLLNLVL